MANTIFTDTLIRANANPLSGGYTTLTSNNALLLISNTIEGTVVGALSPPVPANAAIYTGGTLPADQGISIVIGALNNNSIIGVLLRGSNSLDTSYICSIQGTAGVASTWKIQLNNNGTVTTLNSGAVTPALGDTLFAFIQGTTITFQRNGVTLGTATNSTISTGAVGLYTNPATVLGDVVIAGPVIGYDFVAVSVSPSSKIMSIGGTQTFTQTVTGQGISTSSVTWFINGISGGNSTVGTISAAGLYVAPGTIPSGGSVTLTAQSQADNTTFSSGVVIQIFRTTTVQTFAPSDGGTVANFKAFGQMFGQILPGLGWTQVPLTTDISQVNWSLVTTTPASATPGSNFNLEYPPTAWNFRGAWTGNTAYAGQYNSNVSQDLVTSHGLTFTPVVNLNTGSTQLNLPVTQAVANTNQLFALTSVAASGAGTGGTVAVYQGTITGGAANAYVGFVFTVSGFVVNPLNNGIFICTASTASALTLSNGSATVETNPANASSSVTNLGYLGTFSTVVSGNANGLTRQINLSPAQTGGYIMGVTGFSNAANNVDLPIIASSTTALGVATTGVNETRTAFASFDPYTFNANDGNPGWTPIYYEIYQSTDALSATCPIYLKLLYITYFNTSKNAVSISVGTGIGANGSANNSANGSLLNTTHLYTNSNDNILLFPSASSAIPDECDFSGNAGNLRFCLWRSADTSGRTSPIYLSIERAKDQNGNDLDTYFTVSFAANQCNYTVLPLTFGNQQVTMFKPGTGSQTNPSVWGTIVVNQTDMAYQGMVPTFPVFPIPGYVGNPIPAHVTIPASDCIGGELIRVSMYGATHTYMVSHYTSYNFGQNTPGVTTAGTLGFLVIAFLWENA